MTTTRCGVFFDLGNNFNKLRNESKHLLTNNISNCRGNNNNNIKYNTCILKIHKHQEIWIEWNKNKSKEPDKPFLWKSQAKNIWNKSNEFETASHLKRFPPTHIHPVPTLLSPVQTATPVKQHHLKKSSQRHRETLSPPTTAAATTAANRHLRTTQRDRVVQDTREGQVQEQQIKLLCGASTQPPVPLQQHPGSNSCSWVSSRREEPSLHLQFYFSWFHFQASVPLISCYENEDHEKLRFNDFIERNNNKNNKNYHIVG